MEEKPKRVPKAEKVAANPHYRASIAAVLAGFETRCEAERHSGALKRHARGSLAAAIKLRCIECCDGTTRGVKECNSVACPMWIHRPYQFEHHKRPESRQVAPDSELS